MEELTKFVRIQAEKEDEVLPAPYTKLTAASV